MFFFCFYTTLWALCSFFSHAGIFVLTISMLLMMRCFQLNICHSYSNCKALCTNLRKDDSIREKLQCGRWWWYATNDRMFNPSKCGSGYACACIFLRAIIPYICLHIAFCFSYHPSLNIAQCFLWFLALSLFSTIILLCKCSSLACVWMTTPFGYCETTHVHCFKIFCVLTSLKS